VAPCNLVNSYQFFGALCLPNYIRHARVNRHIDTFPTLKITSNFMLSFGLYGCRIERGSTKWKFKFHNEELCSVFSLVVLYEYFKDLVI